jgi:hypothetical protein
MIVARLTRHTDSFRLVGIENSSLDLSECKRSCAQSAQDLAWKSVIRPQPETIGNCLPQNVAALGEYLQLRVKSQIGIHPGQQNGRKITATWGNVNKN